MKRWVPVIFLFLLPLTSCDRSGPQASAERTDSSHSLPSATQSPCVEAVMSALFKVWGPGMDNASINLVFDDIVTRFGTESRENSAITKMVSDHEAFTERVAHGRAAGMLVAEPKVTAICSG
jgi:hypothetical protein